MKTILITGGAGFIGSNYIRLLYKLYPDYKFLVLDALTYAGSIENLPVGSFDDSRFEFWYGNVRNAELVDSLVERSDIVVHFAAETHVTRSIYDNLLFFETDVIGTQVIANAVLKYRKKIERLIHISTSEVYGTARNELMNEEDPLMPASPYAAAKAGADRLVYSYWYTYDIPITIIRPFNNYGPYQHLEKAVPRFVTSNILGEDLNVHGDGSAARDYIYVEDTCHAINALMQEKIDKVAGEVFNIASGVHRSIHSVSKDIVKLMGIDESKIQFVGERPGQVFRHTGDYSKINKTIGWEPKISWEEGLNRSIQWYRDNQSWWKSQLWMRSVPIITKSGKKEFH
jgi:dTDP-glucose 4,6-dehydratase